MANMGNAKIINLLKEMGKKMGVIEPDTGESVTDITTEITDIKTLVQNMRVGGITNNAYGYITFPRITNSIQTDHMNLTLSNFEGELYLYLPSIDNMAIYVTYGSKTRTLFQSTSLMDSLSPHQKNHIRAYEIIANTTFRIPIRKDEKVIIRMYCNSTSGTTSAYYSIKNTINTTPTATYTDTNNWITEKSHVVMD